MKTPDKFWDRISKNYDKGTDKDFERSINLLKKHIKPSDIVLDYACATGSYTIEVSRLVNNIVGIDLSPKMIERAKEKANIGKLNNVHFMQTTIFDTDLQKQSFDLIYGFNILHLVDDQSKVMQRIKELLKPGGLFISTTPCLDEKCNFMGIFLSLFSKLKLLPKISLLERSDLEENISNSGFQTLETIASSDSIPNQFIIAKLNY